jgi:hypothetical protein
MAERPHRHLPESSRVEAFSDGVLAIAITLLVLDLHSDFSRGNFVGDLAAQWPAYSCLLYAGVGFLVPVAFIAIYTYLSRTPELLADPADTGYTRTARRRAFVSIVTYPVTAALAFWSRPPPWRCSSRSPTTSSSPSSLRNAPKDTASSGTWRDPAGEMQVMYVDNHRDKFKHAGQVIAPSPVRSSALV